MNNQRVGGSNPSRGTLVPVVQLVEHPVPNPANYGSSPYRSIIEKSRPKPLFSLREAVHLNEWWERKSRQEEKKMIDYNITITGPGGCINNLLEVIQSALEVRGISVEVENDHPDSRPKLQEFIASKDNFFAGNIVHVKMNHAPWGA